MNEEWAPVHDFPNYSVSNLGRVRNDETDILKSIRHNYEGIAHTSICYRNRNTSRAVAKLVADAFVPGKDDIFNTPIHLNGDRSDCSAENLAWRPLWFAREYHRQFKQSLQWLERYSHPITDLITGETWPDLYTTGVSNGLIFADVINSIHDERTIFPTRQKLAWA